jgi:hypothetical protein
MTANKTKRSGSDDLLSRLQAMLYEYHAFGRFEEARPHILWLMEIAEREHRAPVSRPS